ncbi:MAG: hypothetical protein QNJ32_22330 [Xenococcaceae cyanobacterium MO_167.B27]|nr:hypothetical protein [Xenococcaceae cyanobacterium MO_167.B27]
MNVNALKDIHRQMRRTGILLFLDSFMEALNNHEQILSVIHLAYASETLLKARIAQEHPLLIFSKLPPLPNNNSVQNPLDIINLFLEKGRTFSYIDLPNQLWAVTGISMTKEQQEKYTNFGYLRNQLIHTSMTSEQNLNLETIKYSVEVLSPLIKEFWGKSIIDFVKNHPEYSWKFYEGMIEESIVDKGIKVDNVLRELLGEESKKGYEKLLARNEEHEERLKIELDTGLIDKQAEEWEKEFGDYPNSHATDPYIEALIKWSNFLDCFCNS